MKSFLERKIDMPMKFIYIDATYFKTREDGRYGNRALYVCIGIDSEGRREILSCKLCDSETEMEWESSFDNLKGSTSIFSYSNGSNCHRLCTGFIIVYLVFFNYF